MAAAPAAPSNGSPTEGKKGGKLEQLGASDVDFLDPGQTYYTGGFQVIYATQTPLYAPKPDSEEAEPALADGEPQISEDDKSVTVKLKKGIKFGPPVNREIEAKDVKYAFERAFTKNVPNQYTTYFNFIEGAPKEPGEHKPISGIVVDNPNQITFKLTQAQGPGFAAFLIMPVTTPIPQEYAEKFDKESPSTYNENVVSSGPYMVANDDAGKLTGYKAGKSIQLVRNPNWDASLDFRPAYLDEILLRTNATDANVSGRQVLSGSEPDPRHQPAGAGAQAGRAAPEGPARHAPGRRLPLVPAEQHDQAAGRHQRPQGDPRGVRPHGGHQGARRRVRRQAGHALHPAGHPRLRGGRRREGPRVRLPGQARGRHGRRREVHEGGGLRLGQVRGRAKSC